MGFVVVVVILFILVCKVGSQALMPPTHEAFHIANLNLLAITTISFLYIVEVSTSLCSGFERPKHCPKMILCEQTLWGIWEFCDSFWTHSHQPRVREAIPSFHQRPRR